MTDATDNPVYDAAGEEDPELLRLLLATHRHLIDIPHPFKKERTPLHQAAMHGRTGAIEALIRAGSEAIDVPDKFGWTPIQYAARYGHAASVEALIRLGSQSIYTADRNGNTALHHAARHGHVEVVEVLMQLGGGDRWATIQPNKDGRTPLHWAAQGGHAAVFDALIRLNSRWPEWDIVDRYGWSPMHFAASKGHIPIIEILAQARSSNPAGRRNWGLYSGFTPVHAASRFGQAAAIEPLANLAGYRICAATNYRDWTPLHYAARYGHVAVIEEILRMDKNAVLRLSSEDRSPLHYAMKHGHELAVETLLRLGARTDIDGAKRMRRAAAKGDVATIEKLAESCKQILDVPSPYFHQRSPLFVAASLGQEAAIEKLVWLGSKAIDTPDYFGATPMHIAAMRKQPGAVETLIRLGSQAMEMQTVQYSTPLALAGSDDVIKVLLTTGANADAIPMLPRQQERIERVQRSITEPGGDLEDEILEIRRRVYFASSLVTRLLFDLLKNAS